MCGLETRTVTLRNATIEDATVIEAVTRVAFEQREERVPPYRALTETVEDVRLHLKRGGAIVAEADGRVVGAVRYRERRPGALFLYRLAVHPDYQRSGIGRRLMQAVEEIARRTGYAEVQLYARHTCQDLIATYGRQGYSEVNDPNEPDYNHPVYLLMSKTV